MTDGILVKELIANRDEIGSKYGVLMIDEVHERSILTDVILGLLKQIIQNNNNNNQEGNKMRIVITSATLDPTLISSYFSNCPILRVEGRNFDVKVYHSTNDLVWFSFHLSFYIN